ncbi:MAG: putative LPS assembly protein LptD, partial [Balneolales bacterium]
MTIHAVAYKTAGKAAITLLLLLITGFWNLSAAQADTISVDQPGQPGQSSRQPPGQENGGAANDSGAINFSASDSLVFTFNPEREARLYGNANVQHTEGELEAGQVILNLEQNLMSAESAAGADTLEEPVLTRGSDRIRSRRVQYNYETDKGKFDVARVSIDKGNLTGTQVKRTDPHVVFVEDGIYSTCELDHPHFYIRAQKMKVVDEDEIFFTNARLFILDIPYPMIFPFGFVPSRIQRTQSGLLEPSFSYQEQQRRGLGIQNIGWFQYFNDYLAGRISFDIFTSGTYYANSRLDYALTDNYTGSVNVGYSRDRGLESTDPNFSTNVQKSLRLTHNQTISPFSRLSANINLRTQDYNNRNSYEIDERAQVTTSSSASYNYSHPENLYNMSLSARQNRNFQTDVTSLSGPDLNFSFRRFTPFQQTGPAAETKWYESFNIRYQSQLRSRFNYNPRNDEVDASFLEALFNPSLHREVTGDLRHFDYGLQQNIDAGSSLLSSQYVNLSTNVSFSEYWYPHTIRQDYVPGEPDSLGNATPGSVENRLERGFTTARNFNTSASLGTTLYGISNQSIGNLEGFRHTIRPSLSFTYSPDFGDEFWGTYRDVRINEQGDTRRYPIYEGSIIGGPSAGKQQSLGLSVSNTFETKQVKRDTTGEVNENVIRLIESLNASLSYNFAAEQFNLSDMSLSARTSLVPNVNLNARANFSFYDRDEDGRRIDRYIWDETNKFTSLSNFNVQASTNFSGGDGGMRTAPGSVHYPRRYDPFDQSVFRPVDRHFNEDPIATISAPWSVDIRFSYR